MTITEDRRPARIRVQLTGLALEVGRIGQHAYRVLLAPEDARQLAADLLANAEQAEHRAAPVLAELEALSGRPPEC